jgi:zeaxanthin glucosyltransferase
MTSRILFVTIPEKGHVNPLIGVAQHLERGGHTIAFLAHSDLSAHLAAAGVAARCFVPEGSAGAPAAPPAEFITKGRAFAEKIRDAAWLRRWIARLLVEVVPAQLPPLRAVIEDFRPDAIATDPMVYAAVIAAESAGIPWAGISSSLNPVTPDEWSTELTETVRALGPARDRLFTDHGVRAPRFKVCDAISPWLNTVFSTEAYAPRRLSGNDFSFYVGASIPPGRRGDEAELPWERLRPDRPLVYISFGSQIFHQPDLFLAAFEALAPAGVDIVASVNELAEDPAFVRRVPEGVVLVHYAPQLALLERADLMITHGGANSVVECLSRGRPLVIVPICNDQPLQARFLAESGAGAVILPQDFTVERCRAAVLPMLAENAPERARARAIGESFAGRDGALRTAELVAELAAARRPLYPEGAAR